MKKKNVTICLNEDAIEILKCAAQEKRNSMSAYIENLIWANKNYTDFSKITGMGSDVANEFRGGLNNICHNTHLPHYESQINIAEWDLSRISRVVNVDKLSENDINYVKAHHDCVIETPMGLMAIIKPENK